jgi:hypothetical protein
VFTSLAGIILLMLLETMGIGGRSLLQAGDNIDAG